MRCCGASSSFVVGTGKVATILPPKIEQTLTTTQVPQPNILSRLNTDDEHENEIFDSENEFGEHTSTLSVDDETTEASGLEEETENIESSHGDIDEEPAESESITETINKEFQQEHKSKDEIRYDEIDGLRQVEESTTMIITTEKQSISNRKPKMLGNVVMVYPNLMSGIPKTTPKNMPETSEMRMFDKEVGMDLHLVFSRTTSKPDLTTQNTEVINDIELSSTVSSTTKPRYKLAKRRRQFQPIRRPSTEAPAEDMELKSTTINSRSVTRPISKVRALNKRPNPQESADSTAKVPRAKLTTRDPIIKEEEILHTSEDDKTHQNRFRLFNARHRLNYLRRSTTTSTTEASIEMSTRHISPSKPLDNRRTSKPDDISNSQIVSNGRPLKMNETLIRHMDSNHRNMISRVRVALMAAATENQIVEIPRSFASADMDNRVKNIEKMLINKIMNVYTEMKAKRRGGRPTTNEPSNIVQNNQEINPEERSISKPTSNSTRPYRGKKKFHLSDLLEKTLIVPIYPNEARRMRVRSTTEKPVEVVTEDVTSTTTATTTTTRRSRRRPFTTVQSNKLVHNFEEKKTQDEDPKASSRNQERNFWRHVNIRRKFAVGPSSTTILIDTVPTTITTTETITTVGYTATPTIITTPSTTPSTTTMPIPITTQSSEVIDASDVIEKSTEYSTPITTQSSKVIGESSVMDKSTEHVGMDEIVQISRDSADTFEFKPSPLWSIKSDEQPDFVEIEPNHSLDIGEVPNENSNRRSRNIFEPPTQYLNGFIPVVPLKSPIQIVGPIPKSNILGDDTRVKYNLPKDGEVVTFSKN